MKGLAAAFTGAVGGLGQGVADVGNKYLDDQILQNRAQVLADIQRKSAVQQAQDIDAYQNDPTRRQNLRELKAQDDAATAASALAAEKARVGDKDYQALVLENQRSQAKVAGEVATEQTIANGKNKDFLESVKAVKLADPEVQARISQARAALGASTAHTRLLSLQGDEAEMVLKDRKAINGLLDTYDATLNDKSIDDKTRGERLTRLTQQLNVIRAKNGKAGGDDTDTVKVTEEQMLPGGGTRKVERTEKRKAVAGGSGDGAAPFDEGTELRNKKDGKVYVMRNGVPVLKDTASAPGAGGSAPATAPVGESPKSTLPEVGPIDQQIYSDLQPLAEAYQDARDKFRAAAKSGDPNAIDYWKKPLVEAEQRLRQVANSRLGNGAQRYFSTLGI